jgi:DNA polymerase IV
VWRHCEDNGSRGRTVTLKVKITDFELIYRSRSIGGPVGSRSELESVSVELYKALFPFKKAVRLLGVTVCGFVDEQTDGPAQIALELQSISSPTFVMALVGVESWTR